MKAYIFPGQASQFEGMGKDMYDASPIAKDLFHHANEILGFKISDTMFNGSAEDLKQTQVTQPAIFLHSIIKAYLAEDAFQPEAVAGHSLGEFSALVAARVLSFESALSLVYKRALAMQKACDHQESTMAAILGLDDHIVEEVCAGINELVIPANYNCPGQLVISGTIKGIEEAVIKCTELGAKRALILPVNGAFHSPLMQSAEEELAEAINQTEFHDAFCPIYQNVDALPHKDATTIKNNLIAQLTAPVKWTQIMQQMIADGVSEIIEVGGNGKTIQGFFKKIDKVFPTSAL